jgi:putative transposase
VEEDEHFLAVARYVERNAQRAGLVARAGEWQWGSLWGRCHNASEPEIHLSDWPLPVPTGWPDWVNSAEDEKQLSDLRTSVQRGRPYGRAGWQQAVAKQLGLESAYGRLGRPRRFARA